MAHEEVVYTKEAKIAGRFLNLHPSNPNIHFWLGARQHRSGKRYHNGNTNHVVNEPGPFFGSREETYPSCTSISSYLSTFLELTFFVLLWALAVLVCRVIHEACLGPGEVWEAEPVGVCGAFSRASVIDSN